MKRLSMLLVPNNHIVYIEGGLGAKLPNLATLVLTNNKLAELGSIDSLSDLPSLTTLSLVGNPLVHHKNYRLYVIYKLPKLHTLDFRKIKRQERAAAVAFFTATDKGAALKESIAANPVKAPAVLVGLTTEQRSMIQTAILNATKVDELDRLQKILETGVMPPNFKLDGASASKPSSPTKKSTPPSPAKNTVAAPAPVSAAPPAAAAPVSTKAAAPAPPSQALSSVTPSLPTNSKVAPVSSPSKPSAAVAADADAKGSAAPSVPLPPPSALVIEAEPTKRGVKRGRAESKDSEGESSRKSSKASSNAGTPKNKQVGGSNDMEVDEEGAALVTKESVSSMRVVDLKSELEKRGLSTKGVKAELVQRLTEAIDSE
jgi:U2 small nuclear ribonucleoprotein A'